MVSAWPAMRLPFQESFFLAFPVLLAWLFLASIFSSAQLQLSLPREDPCCVALRWPKRGATLKKRRPSGPSSHFWQQYKQARRSTHLACHGIPVLHKAHSEAEA